jgi:transketolase
VSAEAASVETWEERYSGAGREVYRRTLLELARADPRVFCLDTDMGGLEDTFAAQLPEQYVDLGIAEANMMSVAAGLAAAGKIPFVNTMSSFASLRAGEQVKLDIAYNDLPVKLVTTHSGLSAGHYGPTHQSCEDLAVMRALPNLTVIVPADAAETEKAVRAAAALPGPAYVRLGRKATPLFHPSDYDFRVGRAEVLRPGEDVSLVAAGGLPLAIALEAREALRDLGLEARVLNLHTLKPIDVQAIVRCAEETRGIVTVEDHSVIGGLGSAVAETVCEHAPAPVKRVGVPDRFCDEVGPHQHLLRSLGVTAERVAEAAAFLCGVRPPAAASA